MLADAAAVPAEGPARPGDARGSQPADLFDLGHWKLQLPGPRDVQPRELLAGFTDGHFYLDGASKELVFSLDAAEKGSTSNSSYVRSELREQLTPNSDRPNWNAASGTHVLTARCKVVQNTLSPNKITVLQIHGIGSDGQSAPPLTRLVFEDGVLLIRYKADKSGNTENKVSCGSYSGYVDYEVKVQGSRLIVTVNGSEKLNRDISYWTWDNYFKAGAYPQATQGRVSVQFAKLSVAHL